MAVHRLFVAVYPPPETAARMLAVLPDLALPPHRTPTPEQVHMTVHFIGDVDTRQFEEVSESVARSAAGLNAFVAFPRRLISLPREGPARLVAVEFDPEPTLLEIHRRLVHRLARSRKQRERGRFLPHMTLARFTQPTPVEPVVRTVDHSPIPIDEVCLVRSTLHAAGAEHSILGRWKLR
ncbi:MAG TPA: RNA 2',3'-cyclic phosphodiesterase [Phycisphaerales bacterium]|nr:RNA 2',3'-cyclic phosphodiesterase [Phycisphaerales bacterium]